MKIIAVAVFLICPCAWALELNLPAPEEVFGAPGNRIILRVGGIPITTGTIIRKNYSDLIQLMKTREAGIRSRNWSDQNEQSFRNYWNIIIKQGIALAVRDELLYMLAQKSNLVAFPSIVEKTTEDRLSRIGGEKALKERGLTVEDLKKEVERDLLIETVTRTQMPPVTPPGPEEVRRFYKEHISEFTLKSAGFRLRLIMLPLKTSDGQDNMPAAEKLVEDIKGGADFAALAAKNSTHPSRVYGGLILKNVQSGFPIDIIEAEDIPGPMRDYLPSLEEGKVYGPVTIEGRLYIFMLNKRFAPGEIPFDELAAYVTEYLRSKAEESVEYDWLAHLAERSGISTVDGKPVPIVDIFGPAPGAEKK